jgi:hypothetical protein
MVVSEAIARELRTEPGEFLVNIEAPARFWLNPYTAESLARGKRHQTVGVTVDAFEVPAVGDPDQLSLVVVTPPVIRTDKTAFHVAATRGNLCPPVAADIQKRTHFTVTVTHNQNRDAAVGVGKVIAGFWNRSGSV